MELEETYSVKGLLFRPHVIANFQDLLGITSLYRWLKSALQVFKFSTEAVHAA